MVSAKEKFCFTWYLLGWGKCLLWESGEQHHIVRPWSSLFKGTLRLIDIMGKNTKESKEIEKVQVQIQVQSVPDGGWGWSVCLAGFIAQFVVLGIQNNTGILYKALLEEFKQSKGETGTVWQLCLIWLQSSIFKRSVSLLSLWTRCWELLFRSKCHLNCGCYLNNKKQLKIRCVVRFRHKFAGFYPIVLCWCDFAEEEKLFATLDEFFLEGTAKLPDMSNRPITPLLWINNAVRSVSL